jgi:hypothetical protein
MESSKGLTTTINDNQIDSTSKGKDVNDKAISKENMDSTIDNKNNDQLDDDNIEDIPEEHIINNKLSSEEFQAKFPNYHPGIPSQVACDSLIVSSLNFIRESY